MPASTVEERIARGRDARKRVPRSSLADWQPTPDRRSPADILAEQDARRVQDLVPLRYERMLASPFPFYRGAAAIMAADLATTPTSGLTVQACGDAHLANFGAFASPERDLLFSLNDFDETLPGPWEWDVKRLLASFEIATRYREFDDATRAAIVTGTARAYREAMADFATHRDLEVWYARLNVADVLERWQDQITTAAAKRVQRSATKARAKDHLRAFDKLTRRVDGEVRLVSDPPLVVPMAELVTPVEASRVQHVIADALASYRESLQPDRRHLVDGYRLVDVARKVVGVGSVGTRCWIVLLLGRDEADPLFLQFKEANASVLEQFGGQPAGEALHGRRVVEGQRLIQAASDIFLGWTHVAGLDEEPRDYYVRQLWDAKFSVDLEAMPPETTQVYGEMCGWTLAKAHARSGDRVAIAAYLGKSDTFDRALRDFAAAYADQNDRDFAEVRAARAAPSDHAAGAAG